MQEMTKIYYEVRKEKKGPEIRDYGTKKYRSIFGYRKEEISK